MNKIIMMACTAVAMSGCTSCFNGDPVTLPVEGFKNMSVTEINAHLDATLPTSSGGGRKHAPESAMPAGISVANGNVMRIQEQRMRVWFAPYQDDDGDFHESRVIHTVVSGGRWVMTKGGKHDR